MQTNRASGSVSQTCWRRIATILSPTYRAWSHLARIAS